VVTDYLSALNIGSGLNTTQIIDALVAAEQEPKEAILNLQKDEATVSISSFGQIKQNFSDLGNAMTAIDGITGMIVSQSGNSVDVEISDSSDISEFSSSIEVNQIAEAHTLVFDGFTSESDSVGPGTLTFEFGAWIDGSFSANSDVAGGDVQIDSEADSLAEVVDAINTSTLSITASIVKKSDTNYALVLKSNEGTENALRISSAEGPADSNLYYLSNYHTNGVAAFNPTEKLSVSETTTGILNTTAEIQSVASFSPSEIDELNGKTLFFHDGTNTLSVEFTSTPADIDEVVSAITSSPGYDNMNFTVSAGADALTLTYNSLLGDVDLADVGYLTAVETVVAKDAELTIDGVSVTRSSNTVTDLIDGVTLKINSVTTSAEIVNGSWDKDTALLALQVFVEQLNASILDLKVLTDRGGVTSEPGALAGDSLAKYLLSSLTKITTQPIVGFEEEDIFLANFGVSTELDGSITIDEETFESYFEANPTHFAAITSSRVKTDTGLVSGTITGDDYTAGVFSFEIDGSDNSGLIDDDTILTNVGSSYLALTGDFAGLTLNTEAGASSANIFLGRSISQTLQNLATQMLAQNSEIDVKINFFNEDISKYDEELAEIETKMESLRARYISQYAAMDAAVAQLKSTETALTNMMDSWRASLES